MNTFRLPDETHLSHVHLRTGNLARALEFYQAVIGLQVIDRSPVTATLSATGSPPVILILTKDQNAVPRPQRVTGLYHLAIRYPTQRDLAHSLLRLIKADRPNSGGSDQLCNAVEPDEEGGFEAALIGKFLAKTTLL